MLLSFTVVFYDLSFAELIRGESAPYLDANDSFFGLGGCILLSYLCTSVILFFIDSDPLVLDILELVVPNLFSSDIPLVILRLFISEPLTL